MFEVLANRYFTRAFHGLIQLVLPQFLVILLPIRVGVNAVATMRIRPLQLLQISWLLEQMIATGRRLVVVVLQLGTAIGRLGKRLATAGDQIDSVTLHQCHVALHQYAVIAAVFIIPPPDQVARIDHEDGQSRYPIHRLAFQPRPGSLSRIHGWLIQSAIHGS